MCSIPKRLLILISAIAIVSMQANAEEPWKFVSIPDLFNNDVLLNDSDWFGDNPDGSNNDGTYAATPYVLNSIATENADFVLVSGDLVQGRWSLDAFSDSQIESEKLSNPAFSHITGSGVEARKQHIRHMADQYYSSWNQMWANAGQTVYSIPGDHEFGDNDWNRSYDKELIPVYREKYGQYRTVPGASAPSGDQQGTAFALTHKNLTLVGIDVFETDSNGNMSIGVSGDQLAWVQDELANASTAHTVVTYHTPVLEHTHSRSSSQLTLPGGENSALWQAMVAAGNVDMTIAGEVHDISAQEKDDILQMVHGSQVSNVPEFNYMVTTVFDDRLEIELKALQTTLLGPRDKSLDPYKVDDYIERKVVLSQSQFVTGFQTVGTITIDKSTGETRFTDATGLMESRLTSLDGLNPPPSLTYFDFENDTTSAGGIDGQGDQAASDGSAMILGNGQTVAFNTDVPSAIAHRSSYSLDMTANLGSDSDNQYISVNSPSYKGVLGDSARTVAGWIKTSAENDQAIVAWGKDGATGGKWLVRLDETEDGSGVWALRVETQGDALVGSLNLADGQWHHVAVVLDEADGETQSLLNATLFVDGQAEMLTLSSNGLALNTISDIDVLLGVRPSLDGRFFDGLMDEIAIWDSALTESQVAALASGAQIPEPTTLGLLGLGGLAMLRRRRA